MNAPGLVLIVAGAWILSQVLAGNALGRLGISGSPGENPLNPVAPGDPTGTHIPGTEGI